MYRSPGLADDLPTELLQAWNDTVQQEYDRLAPSLATRFFVLDPAGIPTGDRAGVRWFGDPAEPTFCLGPGKAGALSDWGTRARHELHNEYCEYAAVRVPDATGRSRLKRIQVTTELREYWLLLAGLDPDRVCDMAASSLRHEVSPDDLYGPGPSPADLAPDARRERFVHWSAGDDTRRPAGSLARDEALFMTHPINGLDDLLYIVMFGARPYAVDEAGTRRPAGRDEIFRANGVEHLACRHADPAAAMAAAGAAYDGRRVAFADPLGMYLQSFTAEVFSLDGGPVPESWIAWSRGTEGLWQRLEFGPPDDDPRFLDEALVSVGSSDAPVTGGFQVVSQIEVGPFVMVDDPAPVADDEFVAVSGDASPIVCSEASACEQVRALLAEFERPTLRRVAPRSLG